MAGKFKVNYQVKREEYIPLRLTKMEKKELERRAKKYSMSMVEYARRKTFDLPLESVKDWKPETDVPDLAAHGPSS